MSSSVGGVRVVGGDIIRGVEVDSEMVVCSSTASAAAITEGFVFCSPLPGLFAMR